jgi:hypothetical protein
MLGMFPIRRRPITAAARRAGTHVRRNDEGMKQKVRWTSSISLVAVGLALAVVAIAVVRFTDMGARPWLYVALVLAMLSALGGLVLAVVRAKQWSD